MSRTRRQVACSWFTLKEDAGFGKPLSGALRAPL
jgi:hypothetical protein